MSNISKFGTLILIAIFCLLHSLPAQDSTTAGPEKFVKKAMRSIGHDIQKLALSPAHMSKRDALHLAVFAASNALLIWRIDQQVDEEFARENEHFYNRPLDAMTWIGDHYNRMRPEGFAATLIGTCTASALVFRSNSLFRTSILLTESYLITGLITRIAKISIGRARPYLNKGPHFRQPFYTKADKEQYFSMPSGHTSSIFATITVLVHRYPKKIIRYPAFALMGSVALQRIETRKHWLSDVVIGAATGYWVASRLVRENKSTPDATAMIPYFDGRSIGLAVQF